MRLGFIILLAAALVLVSGCLCCTSGLGGDSGGKAGVPESGCTPPYIEFEGDCCLDANWNSICDSHEATTTLSPPFTETTVPQQTATTVKPTTTVEAATTTVIATTTTVEKKSGVEDCVTAAGYSPDSIIYAYSNTCGAGEKTKLANYGLRKGVEFQFIDIGILSENEKQVLACFYGPYSKSNNKYRMCPMFLCPKTGAHEAHTHGSVTIKAASFMKDCGVGG
jgi:hypothetical protein